MNQDEINQIGKVVTTRTYSAPFTALKKSKVDDVENILSSVRDFSSSVLKGQSRMEYKNKKLTDLGVAPPKQQTMPFKMRMAINRAKEKREATRVLAAKAAGVVLPRHGSESKHAGKRGKQSGKRDKEDRDGNPDVNVRTKGGVFHVSKFLAQQTRK